MVVVGAMDFQICFAFVWFVVLEVICDSLIFCYNSILCWCFVGFYGCLMGHWNNFLED
jgi:hypothetical protein